MCLRNQFFPMIILQSVKKILQRGKKLRRSYAYQTVSTCAKKNLVFACMNLFQLCVMPQSKLDRLAKNQFSEMCEQDENTRARVCVCLGLENRASYLHSRNRGCQTNQTRERETRQALEVRHALTSSRLSL